MSNNLLPEEFDIVTGLEEGGIVSRTLNTNSPSNQSLLEDFQTIDEILTIPYNTNSCFDLNNLPKTTELSTLLSHLCELMIRFDSAPNKYQKADYEHFVKTITNALIYLYTRDQDISDLENVIHFMGIATLDTDPQQEKIANKHKYPGMYLVNTVGVYTNFNIEVTSLADSIVYFFPKIENGIFTEYEKFTYNIDGSKWELVEGLLRTKDGAKITLQDISEEEKIVIHKTGTLPDTELYKSGDTWLNEETLDLYTLYDDGVTKAWINTGSKNRAEILHSSTVDKNAEPEFQHVTQAERALISSTAAVVNGHTEDIADLQSNKADKATTLSGYTITDAYTKTEINSKISAVFRYKGSIPTYIDLTALTGMTVGDVYNVTETGDNYAWTGTEWDKLSGEIDLSTYLTIVDASNTYETKVNVNSLSNIVSGHTEDISNLETDKANKATTLSGYGITDAYTKDEINTSFENNKTYSNVTYNDLLALINNNELVPNSSYRITDYTTTTAQANTASAGHDFDIIVTALSTNELSEDAKCVRKEGDAYFANAKLKAWEIKYCINNDTARFAWADAVNGKGVIYFMKDEWNNECPYDFKNIQYQTRAGFKYFQWGYNYTFKRDSRLNMIIADVQYYGYVGDSIPMAWASNTCWLRDNQATTVSVMYDSSGSVINYGGEITAVSNENYDVYTFSKTKTASEDFDVSLNGLLYYCYNNTIRPYFTTQAHRPQVLNRITFVGWNTAQNYPGLYCISNTFNNNCCDNMFGDMCRYNTFGDSFCYNTFGNLCYSNTFGDECSYNTFGNYCNNNTFGDNCNSNTFGNGCYGNMFGNDFGYNTFGVANRYNTFGNECRYNTFGDECSYNTFGNGCQYNNFYTGTSGITKKDFIRYIVLEDGCKFNNFYSSLTTSYSSFLQRIRIKGLENTSATKTQITLSETNTKYEWLICYTSSGTLKQYCPNEEINNILPLIYAGL